MYSPNKKWDDKRNTFPAIEVEYISLDSEYSEYEAFDAKNGEIFFLAIKNPFHPCFIQKAGENLSLTEDMVPMIEVDNISSDLESESSDSNELTHYACKRRKLASTKCNTSRFEGEKNYDLHDLTDTIDHEINGD